MSKMFEFIEPERRMTCEELVRWIINNNYNFYLEEVIDNMNYHIYTMSEESLDERVRSAIHDDVYIENTYDDWKEV